jgi:acyl-CoA synthetase (AMP-forming)/AMP-acid ligase II
MPFQASSNLRQLLLSEAIAKTAKLNPHYPYFFALESDVPDAPIETITYKRFVSDVSKVAQALQRSIPKRHAGSPDAHNVGLLGRNSYSYAVHWFSCQFNNWTVCHIIVYSSDKLIFAASQPSSRSRTVVMLFSICSQAPNLLI